MKDESKDNYTDFAYSKFQQRRRQLIKVLSCTAALSFASVSKAGEYLHSQGSAKPESVISDKLMTFLAKITDVILPATDTIGAIDAGVPEFIDFVVNHLYSDRRRANFVIQLSALLDKFNAQSSLTLTAFISQLNANIPLNNSEYQQLVSEIKALTIHGYYTSYTGATTELKYDAIPGRYQGNVPYTEISCAWSWERLRAAPSFFNEPVTVDH